MGRRSRDSEDINPEDFTPPLKKSKPSSSTSATSVTPSATYSSKSKEKKGVKRKKRGSSETRVKEGETPKEQEVLVLDSGSEGEEKEFERVGNDQGNGHGKGKGKGKEKVEVSKSLNSASSSITATTPFSPSTSSPYASTSTTDTSAAPSSSSANIYPSFLPSPRSEIPSVPVNTLKSSSSSTSTSTSASSPFMSILSSQHVQDALQKDKAKANEHDDSESNDRQSRYGQAARNQNGYKQGLKGIFEWAGLSSTSPGAQLKWMNSILSDSHLPLQLVGFRATRARHLRRHREVHYNGRDRQHQQNLVCQGGPGGDAAESIGQADGKVTSRWEIDRGLGGDETTECHAVMISDLNVFLLNLGIAFGVIAGEKDLSQLVWHGWIRTQIFDFVRSTGPSACLVFVATGPTPEDSMAVVVAPSEVKLDEDVSHGLIKFPSAWGYAGPKDTIRMRQTASDYPSPLKEEIVWTADRRYDPIATSLPLDSFDVDLRSYLLSTPGSQLVSTNSLGQLNRFHCKNLDTAVRSKALASPISYSLQDEVYFSESAQVLLSDGTVGEVVKVMKLLDSDDPQAVQKAKEIMFGGLVKVERVPWRPKVGALFGEGTSYLATSALAPKEYHKDTPFSNIALFAASRGRVKSVILATYLRRPSTTSSASSHIDPKPSSPTIDLLSSLTYSKRVSPFQYSSIIFATLAAIHGPRALVKFRDSSDVDQWLVYSIFKGAIEHFDPKRTLELHPEIAEILRPTSLLAFMDSQLEEAARLLSTIIPSQDGQPLGRLCYPEAKVFLVALTASIDPAELEERRQNGSQQKTVERIAVLVNENMKESKAIRDIEGKKERIGGTSASEDRLLAKAQRKR